MTLSNLRWSHWWILSIVLGVAIGFARRSEDDDLRPLGAPLNSQTAFENALTTTLDGQPLFHHLTVSTRKIHDGDGIPHTVDIVRGLYCDGHPDPRDHKFHWRPTFFIAPIPYRHHDNHPATLREILDRLAHSGKIGYTNAWWESYPFLTSMSASLLFLGLLFPTLINLTVHKTLFPPRPPKAVSLFGIKRPPRNPKQPSPTATGPAQTPLDNEPSAAISNNSPEPPLPPSAPPLGRTLTTDRTPPPPKQSEPETLFAARPDDYYPTSRQPIKFESERIGERGTP